MSFIKRNHPGFYHPLFLNRIPTPTAVHHTQKSGNSPAVNVLEDDTHFYVELAAPGLEKEDFKITIEKNQLSIEVNKELSEGEGTSKYNRREFDYSNFTRTFHLPKSADASNIKASYTSGILALAIAKREEAIVKPPRNIEIV